MQENRSRISWPQIAPLLTIPMKRIIGDAGSDRK
jgi:hypothetical protein